LYPPSTKSGPSAPFWTESLNIYLMFTKSSWSTSSDLTPEICHSYGSQENRVKLYRHKTNQGKTSALITGFAACTGSIVVVQDADLEYDPSEISHLIAPIKRNVADVCLGSGDDYHSVRGLRSFERAEGLCGIRNWAWGGMGEYAVLNDYNVFKLPDSVSDEQGALVEPAAVALYAVDNSGLQAGNTVLISGAGPIGALTVLTVNAVGASQIFVAEPKPGRRKFIESWGLDYVLGCSKTMCQR
jgi:glycosyltransferase involved in cell wall biosynthesis